MPPSAGLSNEKRQGLRQPKLQISVSAVIGWPSTNGLLGRDDVAVGVGLGHVDVDAEDLAEQGLGILRAVAGIVARAAVAQADVEEAVGPERHVAAVVVGERLLDERTAVGPHQVERASWRSATSGSAVRRNRATTVWPSGLRVKLT